MGLVGAPFVDGPDGLGGLVEILADWGNNNEEGRWLLYALYALAATKIVISSNEDISICLLQCVDHVCTNRAVRDQSFFGVAGATKLWLGFPVQHQSWKYPDYMWYPGSC